MSSPATLFHGLAVALAIATGRAAEPSPEGTLDRVVVSADRLGPDSEAEAALTPGSVTLLDGDTLHERHVTQLAELLRYVPGMWAESFTGADEVFYSSRGSNLDATDYDKNGIKFLQDGLPVTAADGNNHNRAVDPLTARHAVVAHGANALAYGASTLGGAIDFTSVTARTTAPFSAALSAGSFGDRGGRATLGGVAGDVDGLLTLETQQRDGYRDHSAQDRKGVYGNFGWQGPDRLSMRVYATYTDYSLQLPGELSPAQVASDPEQARADALHGDYSKQVRTWRLAAKTSIAQVAGGSLELGASFEHQSLYHPIVDSPFFSLLIDTAHEDAGAMLRFRREAGSHEVLLGANYGKSATEGGNYQNLGGERGAYLFPTDNHATSLELFALDRWHAAPAWTLVYGTQFVVAERDVGGFKARYDSFNPRVGLIYRLGDGPEWFASVSRIYEAPTNFVLEDQASGGSNPLDAMHGVVLETGLRGSGRHGASQWTWDVTAYYTALRNEILSVDSAAAPGTSLAANIDKTTHAGIETLFTASFLAGGRGLRIEPRLSATFNAFSFNSDARYGNNRLPSAPRYFARGELLLRAPRGVYAGPTFDVVGARYADFANSYRSGAYSLLGARAGLAAGGWDVYVEGRNLLDKAYIGAVTVKDRATPTSRMLYPGAPRALYVGARYAF
ncbi:MAG: TonB-dependent receptor [Steroidobacteraceae bacterium]